MNRGAERLRELFPDRGGVMRLAGEMRVLWSVASRWRSGERTPIAKFRVLLLERYDIPLGDWDVIVVVAMPEPVAEPVLSEPEPVPVVPEPPRQFRSLLFRREPAYAQK